MTTGLSIFFSFVVELVVVYEVLPPTGPDDLPIIAEVIAVLLLLIFFSLLASVILTSLHSKRRSFPRYIRLCLTSKLAKLFFSGEHFRFTSEVIAEEAEDADSDIRVLQRRENLPFQSEAFLYALTVAAVLAYYTRLYTQEQQ